MIELTKYILFLSITLIATHKLIELFHPYILQYAQLITRSYNCLKEKRLSYRGEVVQKELSELIYMRSGKISLSEISLPQYKFYTDLIKKLLFSFSEFGGDINNLLKSLKKGVVLELRYDKLTSDSFRGGVFQFMAIAFVTWSFIISTIVLVKIKISIFTLLTIFILNISGPIAYYYTYNTISKRKFLGFEALFFSMYSIKALCSSGVSISTTLSEYNKLKGGKVAPNLKSISKRLSHVVFRYSNFGISISNELDDLISELWEIKESSLSSFTKSINLIKFSISIIFYFLPYFIFLYALVSSFS